MKKKLFMGVMLVAMLSGAFPAAAADDCMNYCDTCATDTVDTSWATGVTRTYETAKDGTVKVYEKSKDGTVMIYEKAKDGTVKVYKKSKDGTVKAYNKAVDWSKDLFNKTKEKIHDATE